MPRKARAKSITGIYHVMLRGINKQNIFEDDEDKQKFMQVFTLYKKTCEFEVYAYCLMNNHVHFLIKEGKEELSKIIKRIGTKYVYWYNWKYERTGHLFQDRFKSEAVEDDGYLLMISRYIFQNPVKAGMVNKIFNYKWSGYNDYFGKGGICDYGLILSILSPKEERAKERYTKFMNEENDDKCLEMEENQRLTDKEIVDIIKRVGKLKNVNELQRLDIERRDNILRELRKVKGLSIRTIARITGINRGVVLKA